jgi:hypothetical protein
MQIRGSKAGGALRLSSPCKSSVVIPGSPSARLTRGLKLNTGQWLLRFSVLRETHMTSFPSIPFQKAIMLRYPQKIFPLKYFSRGESGANVLQVIVLPQP